MSNNEKAIEKPSNILLLIVNLALIGILVVWLIYSTNKPQGLPVTAIALQSTVTFSTASTNKTSCESSNVNCQPTKATHYGTPTFDPYPIVLEPDGYRTVKQISTRGAGNRHNATSDWELGGFPSTDYRRWFWPELVSWAPIAGHRNAFIVVENLPDDHLSTENKALVSSYEKSWTCPRSVGEIYITNITAPLLEGKAYFSTDSGVIGSLDLTTGVWFFDNITAD